MSRTPPGLRLPHPWVRLVFFPVLDITKNGFSNVRNER